MTQHRVRMHVEDPGNIKVTLTWTMTVEHWQRLREQMDSLKWPACDVTRDIADMVRQVEARFEPEPR